MNMIRHFLCAMVLFLTAICSFAQGISGTWKVVYLVKVGSELLGMSQAVVAISPGDTQVDFFREVTFRDGTGAFTFDGNRTQKFFYSLKQKGQSISLMIQPQGSEEIQWYYTTLPDNRIFVALQWLGNSLVAVMEKQ